MYTLNFTLLPINVDLLFFKIRGHSSNSYFDNNIEIKNKIKSYDNFDESLKSFVSIKKNASVHY